MGFSYVYTKIITLDNKIGKNPSGTPKSGFPDSFCTPQFEVNRSCTIS
jgi:hypothetical protein